MILQLIAQIILIKEIIINMTYLLLPSSRLAFYQSLSQRIRVLPIKAEEIVQIQHNQLSKVILSSLKTVSIYDAKVLQTGTNLPQLQPLAVATFNKKVEGLTHNGDNVFVSDKFGDIYSIGFDGSAKYLNSNLGIPTFLQFIKANNKRYIAVGDEDTRVKIYNQARMHQIRSFWFLAKKIPLQLLQPVEKSLLLLTKRQHQNNYTQEINESAVQLYELNSDRIQDSEFNGKLLYVSKQHENGEECKYQIIINSSTHAFLLKLFNKKIKVVCFAFHGTQFKQQKTRQSAIVEGDWDMIYGCIANGDKEQLVIVYGKAYSLQEMETNDQAYFKDVLSKEDQLYCSLNNNEHLIVYKL